MISWRALSYISGGSSTGAQRPSGDEERALSASHQQAYNPIPTSSPRVRRLIASKLPLSPSSLAFSKYPVYPRPRTHPDYSPYNRQRWRKTASGQLPPTRARARLTISRSCLEERRQRLMRSHKPMASRRMTSRKRVGGHVESGRGPSDAAPDIS